MNKAQVYEHQLKCGCTEEDVELGGYSDGPNVIIPYDMADKTLGFEASGFLFWALGQGERIHVSFAVLEDTFGVEKMHRIRRKLLDRGFMTITYEPVNGVTCNHIVFYPTPQYGHRNTMAENREG